MEQKEFHIFYIARAKGRKYTESIGETYIKENTNYTGCL